MSSTKYRIEHENLLIISEDTGLIIWKGKPNGINVINVFPVMDSEDCVLYMDPEESWKQRRVNLLRINKSGEILWEVEPPITVNYIGPKREPLEVYIQISRVGERTITASTFSCYSDEIDINTGKIIHSVFTK